MNIILDRYAHSGVAYSSAKVVFYYFYNNFKGLDIEWCKNCDRGLLKPDVIIFLNIDENEAKKRSDYGDEIYEKIEF